MSNITKLNVKDLKEIARILGVRLIKKKKDIVKAIQETEPNH